jgi:hypothetical protein
MSGGVLEKAIKTSLVVWRYLRDNPFVRSKRGLPPSIVKLIDGEVFWCPLCTLFVDDGCAGCPLAESFWPRVCESYNAWSEARYDDERALCAGGIVSRLEKALVERCCCE